MSFVNKRFHAALGGHKYYREVVKDQVSILGPGDPILGHRVAISLTPKLKSPLSCGLTSQVAASFLTDPLKFERTRAGLPPSAKSTIALAFSCNRESPATLTATQPIMNLR